MKGYSNWELRWHKESTKEYTFNPWMAHHELVHDGDKVSAHRAQVHYKQPTKESFHLIAVISEQHSQL